MLDFFTAICCAVSAQDSRAFFGPACACDSCPSALSLSHCESLPQRVTVLPKMVRSHTTQRGKAMSSRSSIPHTITTKSHLPDMLPPHSRRDGAAAASRCHCRLRLLSPGPSTWIQTWSGAPRNTALRTLLVPTRASSR